MDTSIAPTVAFLAKEAEFVYSLYQAAELEVRATERYVLIGLAAMYSYLAATSDIPRQFRNVAWYAPTFVVVFAGIRALGLGWRQAQLMRYLRDMEGQVLGSDACSGWAHSFLAQRSIVALSAGVFYFVLAIFTALIAYRMTKVTPPQPAPEGTSSQLKG
jgi:hypothetical protein